MTCSHLWPIIPITVQAKMKPVAVSLLALFLVACSDGGPDARREMPSFSDTGTPTATSTVTPEPTLVPTATTTIGPTQSSTVPSTPISRPEPSPTQVPRPTPTAEEIILNTVVPSPKAMVNAIWGWNPTLSFDEISVTVYIHNDIEYSGANGLYLIGCTSFSIGENDAYFGLQTDVNTGPDGGWRNIGKGGIFYVWDVPSLEGVRGPDGAWIEAGDYQGSFISVRRSNQWGAGRYTMRVSAEETDEFGRWFGYYVNDTWIGSLRFGRDARILPYCETSIEVYGADVKPSDIPYWKVSMTAPASDGGPAELLRTLYPDIAGGFKNALVTVEDGLVTFEVGLDYIPAWGVRK